MKSKVILVAALASALVGGGALVATNAVAQGPVKSVGAGRLEKHPEIRKAMRQLNAALNTMKQAADDFKGHKEAAMDDTQKALAELKLALQADRN